MFPQQTLSQITENTVEQESLPEQLPEQLPSLKYLPSLKHFLHQRPYPHYSTSFTRAHTLTRILALAGAEHLPSPEPLPSQEYFIQHTPYLHQGARPRQSACLHQNTSPSLLCNSPCSRAKLCVDTAVPRE